MSRDSDAFFSRVHEAIADEYAIEGELGRGGMATVFAATDRQLRRKVAIKVMSPEMVGVAGVQNRFVIEARTAAYLDHPNIITVYSVKEVDDLLLIVMKFVDGRTIGELNDDRGPVEVDVAASIVTRVADALHYAHGEGIVHRDIKPSNILIDRRGRPIVTDFGIAKIAPGAPTRIASVEAGTMPGTLLGTAAYMSPEQCRGLTATPASDQYSLGVTAYELLSGRPPFEGPMLSLIDAHKSRPPRPLRERAPHVDPDVEETVMRMLAKDPDQRWPSLHEVTRRMTSHAAAAGARPESPEMKRRIAELATPERSASADPADRPKSTPSPNLAVRPGEPSIEVGEEVRLVLRDPGDGSLGGAPVRWRSEDVEVAEVDGSGLVTGRAPGVAKITAKTDEGVGRATVTVTPATAGGGSGAASPVDRGVEPGPTRAPAAAKTRPPREGGVPAAVGTDRAGADRAGADPVGTEPAERTSDLPVRGVVTAGLAVLVLGLGAWAGARWLGGASGSDGAAGVVAPDAVDRGGEDPGGSDLDLAGGDGPGSAEGGPAPPGGDGPSGEGPGAPEGGEPSEQDPPGAEEDPPGVDQDPPASETALVASRDEPAPDADEPDPEREGPAADAEPPVDPGDGSGAEAPAAGAAGQEDAPDVEDPATDAAAGALPGADSTPPASPDARPASPDDSAVVVAGDGDEPDAGPPTSPEDEDEGTGDEVERADRFCDDPAVPTRALAAALAPDPAERLDELYAPVDAEDEEEKEALLDALGGAGSPSASSRPLRSEAGEAGCDWVLQVDFQWTNAFGQPRGRSVDVRVELVDEAGVPTVSRISGAAER